MHIAKLKFFLNFLPTILFFFFFFFREVGLGWGWMQPALAGCVYPQFRYIKNKILIFAGLNTSFFCCNGLLYDTLILYDIEVEVSKEKGKFT